MLLEIFLRYSRYVSVLKWLTLSLFAYVATVFAVGVALHPALKVMGWLATLAMALATFGMFRNLGQLEYFARCRIIFRRANAFLAVRAPVCDDRLKTGCGAVEAQSFFQLGETPCQEIAMSSVSLADFQPSPYQQSIDRSVSDKSLTTTISNPSSGSSLTIEFNRATAVTISLSPTAKSISATEQLSLVVIKQPGEPGTPSASGTTPGSDQAASVAFFVDNAQQTYSNNGTASVYTAQNAWLGGAASFTTSPTSGDILEATSVFAGFKSATIDTQT